MAILGADGSVNVNKTFSSVFGSREKDFPNFADELYAGLYKYISLKKDLTCLEAEKDGVYYEISIKNMFGKKDRVVGQLMTINDVTATKQLTLERERARIASGLHDSMGNQLIVSINNLNLATIQPALKEAEPFIDSAATSAVASLMMLRRIVEGLSPVDFSKTKLITLMKSIANRITASGVYVDLQITGDPEKLPTGHKEFVYNVCQEAFTNSIIHGKADNIIIKFDCADTMLKLDIVDNGLGCEEIYKNNGLTAMENRAWALGGQIRFGSPSSGGFGIYTEIPVVYVDGVENPVPIKLNAGGVENEIFQTRRMDTCVGENDN
jgi:signal transduction histidine kinase